MKLAKEKTTKTMKGTMEKKRMKMIERRRKTMTKIWLESAEFVGELDHVVYLGPFHVVLGLDSDMMARKSSSLKPD